MARRAQAALVAALVALSLATAAAKAQCTIAASGQTFDLSQANDGKCGTRARVAASVRRSDTQRMGRVAGGPCAVRRCSDVYVIMTADFASLMNACNPINSLPDGVCTANALACQKFRSSNLSYKLVANRIASSTYGVCARALPRSPFVLVPS